jgi:uncharacterized protein (DUF1499 family)
MRGLSLDRWLVVAGLVLFVAGPVGTRLGIWSFVVGFAGLALGGLCGLAAALIAVVGGVRVGDWRRAAWGMLGGAALVSIPALQVARAAGAPPIHDVSTDTADPPAFVAAIALRAAAGAANPAEYGGPDVAALQRRAFPDIQPLVMNAPPAQAFERVLSQVRALGWDVSAADPAEGRIEAVDTTFFFGFKDDVVIRLRPVPGGTRVDVRSTSRVGVGDAGTNAARIGRLLAALRSGA